MKAGILNPFIKALPVFCEAMTGTHFQYHDATMVKTRLLGKKDGIWLIEVPISGQLNGQVVYSLDHESAISLASQTLMGLPVRDLDDLAMNALLELAKRTAAHAAIGFQEAGYTCFVGQPRLVTQRAPIPQDIPVGIRLVLEGQDGLRLTTDLFLQEVPAHRIPERGSYLN